jgi:hypothetical protein
MIAHWNSQKSIAIGSISYDNVFKCGFLECQNLPESNAHLQHEDWQDDYPFLQPVWLPPHRMQHRTRLPESRLDYVPDAQLIRKADKAPFPTTNLHELFRQSHSKDASKKIN